MLQDCLNNKLFNFSFIDWNQKQLKDKWIAMKNPPVSKSFDTKSLPYIHCDLWLVGLLYSAIPAIPSTGMVFQ